MWSIVFCSFCFSLYWLTWILKKFQHDPSWRFELWIGIFSRLGFLIEICVSNLEFQGFSVKWFPLIKYELETFFGADRLMIPICDCLLCGEKYMDHLLRLFCGKCRWKKVAQIGLGIETWISGFSWGENGFRLQLVRKNPLQMNAGLLWLVFMGWKPLPTKIWNAFKRKNPLWMNATLFSIVFCLHFPIPTLFHIHVSFSISFKIFPAESKHKISITNFNKIN